MSPRRFDYMRCSQLRRRGLLREDGGWRAKTRLSRARTTASAPRHRRPEALFEFDSDHPSSTRMSATSATNGADVVQVIQVTSVDSSFYPASDRTGRDEDEITCLRAASGAPGQSLRGRCGPQRGCNAATCSRLQALERYRARCSLAVDSTSSLTQQPLGGEGRRLAA